MEKHFALIKNNIVEGIIVADAAFIEQITNQYDLIMDVTDGRPHVGDSYYPTTKSFISNDIEVNNIPVDMSATHMQSGTENGFKPLKLSKYIATYKDGMVTIGCKSYSAAGLFDAAHKVLIEKQNVTSHFIVTKDGAAHGKFGITLSDIQKLYDVLKNVKL